MSDSIKLTGVNIKGFGRIPKLVMLDKRLSIEAKAIYAYLASFSGGGQTVYPSREKIVSDLCISINRYYKHFNLLLDHGFITIEKQGFVTRNAYVLNENVVTETDDYDKIYDAAEENMLKHSSSVLSKGYGTIPKLVMQDQNLSIESKAIYALFCSFAGSGNTASPKVDHILSFLQITPKRYYKFIKELEELEYISIEQHVDNSDPTKIRKQNIYVLLNKNGSDDSIQNGTGQNEYTQIEYSQNEYMQNEDFQNEDFQNGDYQNGDYQNGYSQNEYIVNQKLPINPKNSKNPVENGSGYGQNEYMQNEYMQNGYMQNEYNQNEYMQIEDNQNEDMQFGDKRNGYVAIDNKNNQNINKNNINNQSFVGEISDEDLVMEMIENNNQIPYETANNPQKMKQTLEFITNYKEMISEMPFQEKCLSANILRILIEISTNQTEMTINGQTVRNTDVIDRINENIEWSMFGMPEMLNFFPSFIKEYKEVISKRKVTNPNKYLASCIYNWLCIGNLLFNTEEGEKPKKTYDFEMLARQAFE